MKCVGAEIPLMPILIRQHRMDFVPTVHRQLVREDRSLNVSLYGHPKTKISKKFKKKIIFYCIKIDSNLQAKQKQIIYKMYYLLVQFAWQISNRIVFDLNVRRR